jgi:hypothetical protein
VVGLDQVSGPLLDVPGTHCEAGWVVLVGTSWS